MSRPAATTITGRYGCRRRRFGRLPALALSLLLSCSASAAEVPASPKLQPAEITTAATQAMILSAARAGKRIVAVGKGKVNENGKITPLDVKVNDRILFGKYSGSEINIDGEEHLIMREEDILGVIEK